MMMMRGFGSVKCGRKGPLVVWQLSHGSGTSAVTETEPRGTVVCLMKTCTCVTRVHLGRKDGDYAVVTRLRYRKRYLGSLPACCKLRRVKAAAESAKFSAAASAVAGRRGTTKIRHRATFRMSRVQRQDTCHPEHLILHEHSYLCYS